MPACSARTRSQPVASGASGREPASATITPSRRGPSAAGGSAQLHGGTLEVGGQAPWSDVDAVDAAGGECVVEAFTPVVIVGDHRPVLRRTRPVPCPAADPEKTSAKRGFVAPFVFWDRSTGSKTFSSTVSTRWGRDAAPENLQISSGRGGVTQAASAPLEKTI